MIKTQYEHRVQYYETDKMGIVHHSNYIRWMEEARVDFFDKIGWPYDRLEREGMISPVIGVECRYKHPSSFGDAVTIMLTLEEFRKARLVYAYEMVNQNGDVVCEGKSEHCILNEKGMPVRLSRSFPVLFEELEKMEIEP